MQRKVNHSHKLNWGAIGAKEAHSVILRAQCNSAWLLKHFIPKQSCRVHRCKHISMKKVFVKFYPAALCSNSFYLFHITLTISHTLKAVPQKCFFFCIYSIVCLSTILLMLYSRFRMRTMVFCMLCWVNHQFNFAHHAMPKICAVFCIQNLHLSK